MTETIETLKSREPKKASFSDLDRSRLLVLRSIILFLICVLAVSSRLFSVLRYESIIHEFDPWFNYRATAQLVREGFYGFINWFDETAWYPMGRFVGETVYPGLMVTAGFMHWVFNSMNIPVHIREVCVFTAPIFSAFTATVVYLMTYQVTLKYGTALIAAYFVSVVPAYMQRSVAGSYDNEGVSIFAMVFVFYLWVKAVKTGSIRWAVLCALSYLYMVASWGGYIFVINLIPLYVFAMILLGRFSNRLYVAYSVFYTVGTLLSMQISFVSFQPVSSGDHFPAFAIFGLVQLVAFARYLQWILPPVLIRRLIRIAILVTVSAVVLTIALVGVSLLFTGRLYHLLDPTHARGNIPIIASVSEHQPIVWSAAFFDLFYLLALFPAGVWVLFTRPTDAKLFLALYGAMTFYFAFSMVRLLLVLAPVACMVGAVGIGNVLEGGMAMMVGGLNLGMGDATAPTVSTPAGNTPATAPASGAKKLGRPGMRNKNSSASGGESAAGLKHVVGLVIVFACVGMLTVFCSHSIFAASSAYSHPTIVMISNQPDGSRVIIDDYREAYMWLRQNTPEDAKIMSWWDYGYQISGMANRTVIVDNNTRNNTHIAMVGRMFASDEATARDLLDQFDVDYVLVIFGGFLGYSSDDINKFLWMVRISANAFPDYVKESNFYGENGAYRIDSGASSTMRNCLMYKLCYHGFGSIPTQRGYGFDRTRNAIVADREIPLTHFEEAFTSSTWLVRVYEVKGRPLRQ